MAIPNLEIQGEGHFDRLDAGVDDDGAVWIEAGRGDGSVTLTLAQVIELRDWLLKIVPVRP